MTSTVATPRTSVSRQPSIVTHRWFPKVIGLWFAALFGLCSLAVASDVLERVVTTLGVDQIVPAAAPPLGQTARLLLAMAMAGVGEILGLIIGGRLAARHRARSQRGVETAERGDAGRDSVPQVRGRDRHADAPPRKPLSATDDLGGIDRALRRRALISETDHEPRPFFEGAPLPGANPSSPAPFDSPAEPPAALPTPPFSDPAPREILDLETCGTPIGQEAVPDTRPFAAPEGAFGDDDTPAHVVTEAADAAIAQPMASPQPTAVVDVATAPLDTLGVVHLSERLALALKARRERQSRLLSAAAVVAPVPSIAPAAAPQTAEPARSPGLYAPLADPPAVAAQPAVADPPAVASQPAEPPRLPRLYAPLADALDDEESQDIPALARSLTLPAASAIEPDVAADEPEEAPTEFGHYHEMLARRAPKASAEIAPVEEVAESPDGLDSDEVADDDADASAAGYSSLLAMGTSFARSEPVRIDEPESAEIEPVVVFPGHGVRPTNPFVAPAAAPFAAPFGQPGAVAAPEQAFSAARTATTGTMPPADPEETDRALRAALASLQRISGAR